MLEILFDGDILDENTERDVFLTPRNHQPEKAGIEL